MLDPVFVRDHVDLVRAGLRNRGIDPDKALEEFATLESAARRIIPEIEALKRQQNTSGDQTARAARQGQDTTAVREAGRARSQRIKMLDNQLASVEHQRSATLLGLPNLPHATGPVGKSAAANVKARRHGQPRVS